VAGIFIGFKKCSPKGKEADGDLEPAFGKIGGSAVVLKRIHEVSVGYYQKVIGFMRNLLSGAFKDNISLEKGVLTGILRIAKDSYEVVSNRESGYGRYDVMLIPKNKEETAGFFLKPSKRIQIMAKGSLMIYRWLGISGTVRMP
jgi:hypothetical protein